MPGPSPPNLRELCTCTCHDYQSELGFEVSDTYSAPATGFCFIALPLLLHAREADANAYRVLALDAAVAPGLDRVVARQLAMGRLR
eukprot:COSAG05_NODE_4245_length_1606_cov_18.880557_1_plen_85_part_10